MHNFANTVLGTTWVSDPHSGPISNQSTNPIMGRVRSVSLVSFASRTHGQDRELSHVPALPNVSAQTSPRSQKVAVTSGCCICLRDIRYRRRSQGRSGGREEDYVSAPTVNSPTLHTSGTAGGCQPRVANASEQLHMRAGLDGRCQNFLQKSEAHTSANLTYACEHTFKH